MHTRAGMKPQDSKTPGPFAIVCWLPDKNQMNMHPETRAHVHAVPQRDTHLYPSSVVAS